LSHRDIGTTALPAFAFATAGKRFAQTLCENAPHREMAGWLYEVIEISGSMDHTMYLNILSTD
jgi:hypothetical protein